MATYSKSLEDYFRIPILIKSITPLAKLSQQKIAKLCYQYFKLPIDDRYSRQQHNPNTQPLILRQNCTQKFYFTAEDFANDWPEFEVIYKVRFAIGVIDDLSEEKQVEEVLAKMKNENSFKMIGILDMGSTCQNLVKRENIVKYPDVQDSEFTHFIEPWLYNCLTIVESEICNFIAEAKRDDESNRTIVFNRMEDKLDAKTVKKKKKYRCLKISADYHLMLQLYKQAFGYYCEAEEQLRKLDDYLWVLGAQQGKLACAVMCPSLNLSNYEEYIEDVIAESCVVAKRVRNANFQVENSLKIARLYLAQPQKFDQLVKSILSNYGKGLHDDQKFLLFTVLGELYGRCGLTRRKNALYFSAAVIHLSKKSQLSEVLLIQIQKSKQIKEWPFLYKHILQLIIQQSQTKTGQYYLELLSKCGNDLSQAEIDNSLSALNFSNQPLCELCDLDFVVLKDFLVVESKVKPKLNRIGSRESPIKPGPAFFMSWKKDEFLLFQENEAITFRGILTNRILFPVRVKISFQAHSLTDSRKQLPNQQLFFYLQPNSSHKFEQKLRLKGATQQIWVIDSVHTFAWNFKSKTTLKNPIKIEIYEKQSELELRVPGQITWEESCCLNLGLGLKANAESVAFCLARLSVCVYYSVDVGFQENQIFLAQADNFKDIEFQNPENFKIVQSMTAQQESYACENGVLTVFLKRLKVHRKFISRIEFNLQYIRSMNTKYQTSRNYVTRCKFYKEFGYEVQEISTPTIKQIYKNPVTQLKIIEAEFKVRVKVTKLGHSQSTSSYLIHHAGKEYRFKYENFLFIDFTRPKRPASELQAKDLVETIKWQNIFHKNQRGELQVVIPCNELMIKCEKEVTLQITQHSSKAKTIQYTIYSSVLASLSHTITLNPVEMEIDRMYVLRGKTKIESEKGTVGKNQLKVQLDQKCKNSYQIGIIFKDGWTYWHNELLSAT